MPSRIAEPVAKALTRSAVATTDVSIVIPCYNEADGIRETAETVLAYLANHFPQYQVELVLINDGSTDETGLILKKLSEENPDKIHPIYFAMNQGRGAAIKAGLRASQGKVVILLDADLSYDVDHIGEILQVFELDPATDVVIVSVYMEGGLVRNVRMDRFLLSWVANKLLSGFFFENLSTVTCVVRGYRGDLIRSIPFYEEGKELHLEILRKLSLCGAKMVEIPGRLVWKNDKANKPRRKNNLKVVRSAKRHILYGLLINPTSLFKGMAALLILVGLYESATILVSTLNFFQPSGSLVFSLWQALKSAFLASPHTFLIAGVSLILGFQTISYLAIMQVLKMQQEETLRHILALLEHKTPQHS